MTALEQRTKQVLAWARRDQKAILAEPKPSPPPLRDRGGYHDHDPRELAQWRLAVADWQRRRDEAAAGFITIELAAWLKRKPSRSEIELYSRAYLAGAEAGYWQRVMEGGKTWGLRLR